MTKPFQEPLEDIEIKVLKHLRKVGAPNAPRQIPPYIHEHLDPTIKAINSLLKKGLLESVFDLTMLGITGESRSVVITQSGLSAISNDTDT